MTAAYRCLACGRALTAFTVSYQTRTGEVGYGPICGARFVVKKSTRYKPRPVLVKVRRRRKPDPAQLLLVGVE